MTHPIDPDDFPPAPTSKDVILTMYHGTPLSKDRILKEGLRPRKCSEYVDEVKKLLNVDNVPNSIFDEVYQWCSPGTPESALNDPEYKRLITEQEALGSTARDLRRADQIHKELLAVVYQHLPEAERPIFVTGDANTASGYARTHADIGLGELSCIIAHNLVHLSKYARWRRENPQAKISFKSCVYQPPNIVKVKVPLHDIDSDCQREYRHLVENEHLSSEAASAKIDSIGCQVTRPIPPSDIVSVERVS